MSPEEALSVMVVDDEPGIRTALRANFLRHGWSVATASCVREAVRNMDDREFDLIVTDMRMPDGTGMEVMRAARKTSPDTAVILLTAHASVPDAVTAMRDGALDYLTKPIPFDRLQSTAAQLVHRVTQSPAPAEDFACGEIIGRSPLLARSLQRARAAASAGADVLIEAESGTGKELLARYIHDLGARCDKPFIAVNCAAVPESLLESELFGHGRGAFTGAVAHRSGKFELADGGTILLDEIGEMPLNLQPKLLRVLQEREFERLGETTTVQVDIRVIATTNVSLATMVERGQFRADLYYRLNVIPLTLPALRDRQEDIPVLARHFAEKYAAHDRVPCPHLLPDFLDRLQSHSWPGNVRELANFMRRVVTLAETSIFDSNCFEMEFHGQSGLKALPRASAKNELPAGTPIWQVERSHLENTLALTDGNRTHAAEMLGISLRTLRNKIRSTACRQGGTHNMSTTTPIMQMLQGYLKVTSDRQEMIASNIANADTPGYHTRDVNFQAAMQQVTDENNDVQFAPASSEVEGLPERPDGNNVNVDRESLLMGETQLQYQMGVQLIKSEFHRLLSAIKEGN